MDKEKVKNYLKNYFFPITSASQEERRGMYRGAVEDGYLHYEGDLTEWERKRQWEEFDRLMQLERTPVVVAQYDSLDEMVRDGWCVGSLGQTKSA